MKTVSITQHLTKLLCATVFLVNGCTTLVNDAVRQGPAAESHCSGKEWSDNSSVAVLPIPVVAFFVPHVDIHEIKADDFLKRCGEPARLMNRHVEVSRVACVPAALTRIITLGIWQWCPARVSWDADLAKAGS
jgi:hypothetical protein